MDFSLHKVHFNLLTKHLNINWLCPWWGLIIEDVNMQSILKLAVEKN